MIQDSPLLALLLISAFFLICGIVVTSEIVRDLYKRLRNKRRSK